MLHIMGKKMFDNSLLSNRKTAAHVLITVIYKKRNETKSIKTTYIFSPK